MAVHGSNARLYANGIDLTAQMQDATITDAIDTADATVWGSTYEAHIVDPMLIGDIHAEGLHDGAASGVAIAVHNTLKAARALQTNVATLMLTDTAVGDPGAGVYGSIPKYDVKPALGAAVQMDFDAKSLVGIEWLKSLLPLTAKTTTFNGTSLDNAASTANGGAAYLHCTAFTGTTASLKVQHSTDNASWADLATFAAVTAVGSQRVAVAPGTTVNRYLRVICTTFTGTTMTFSCGFCRQPAAL